jgi:hypothetical protein
MGMFAIYQQLTKKQIKDSAEETVPLLEKWFKDNPKRKDCDAELWMGNRVLIKRKGAGSIKDQVWKEANRLIKDAPTKIEKGSVDDILGKKRKQAKSMKKKVIKKTKKKTPKKK